MLQEYEFGNLFAQSELLAMGPVNRRDEETSERILKYLGENPEGGDTVEGISIFWLQFGKIDQSVDEVKDALEGLVRKGLLRKLRAPDGKTIYKIGEKTSSTGKGTLEFEDSNEM